MAGILFDDIIFGPIHSRRLGNSLGINLLPKKIKYCTFNCIYCECGWGQSSGIKLEDLHPAKTIIPVIEKTIKELSVKNIPIDSITYAGNGEPTIHPEFLAITDALISIRNKYYPNTLISCLSNSTQLHRPDILEALKKIDNPIMKLDTGIQETFLRMNNPFITIDLDSICHNLQLFNGNVCIQTMFLRGRTSDGFYIDNTTDKEVDAWIERIKIIKPHTVMIYPIDRETTLSDLQKIDIQTLEHIAEKVRALKIKTLTYA
ncbi:MAG: radical SAM protein [Bacteroidales bacterium]|nr:radical SAM protein [Bacteroidales bacterium]